MAKTKSSIMPHPLSAVCSLIVLAGNIYLIKSVAIFGSPLLFAAGIAIEIAVAIVLIYSLLHILRRPIAILISIVRSAWNGVLSDPYVRKFRQNHEKLSKWIATRFDGYNPGGLYLTLGAIVTLLFLVELNAVLHNVDAHGSLAQIDVRVLNLMPRIRTPFQNDLFRAVTYSYTAPSIVLLVLLAAGILWRLRQRIAAISFVIVLFMEEVFYTILKHVVDRTRPAAGLSLYHQAGPSFPSGHAVRATVLGGMIAYLLFRSFQSALARFVIVFVYLSSVVMVALSRVYLGVHYPSDVLAGVLLGGALVAATVTVIEILTRYRLWGQTEQSFKGKQLLAVPVVVIAFSLIVSPFMLHFSSHPTPQHYTVLTGITTTSAQLLPHYSETMTGKTMEPINFIYIGSDAQIKQLFLSHGWYQADPSTVANTLKALAVGFQGSQYLNAPVTPSYLASQPEDLAFQQPTKSNTLRQRHHTRLWKTSFKLIDGSEVWVGTASYDEGIEFVGAAKIPTHHIDPNVDAERGYIISSLGLGGTRYLQLVKPQAGKNAGGDIFFTDGRVFVADLTH